MIEAEKFLFALDEVRQMAASNRSALVNQDNEGRYNTIQALEAAENELGVLKCFADGDANASSAAHSTPKFKLGHFSKNAVE